MVKALKIKDFPDYYITDTGDIYSRTPVHNPNGRIKKINPWVNKYGYKMVDLIKDGKIIAEFYGTCEANRKTGIDFRRISACCLGKNKTANGYQWKYKEEK